MRSSESAQRSRASAQRLDAERFRPSRLAGLRDDGAGAAERPHRDDAEPELLGERQDLALDLPLARVVRHLDRLDPAGPHDARELVEGRRLVVGRADEADVPGVALALEPRQALLPGDEIVDLLELDVAAVEGELVGSAGDGPRPRTASRSSSRRSLRRDARRAPRPGSVPPDRTSGTSRRAASRPQRPLRPPRVLAELARGRGRTPARSRARRPAPRGRCCRSVGVPRRSGR